MAKVTAWDMEQVFPMLQPATSSALELAWVDALIGGQAPPLVTVYVESVQGDDRLIQKSQVIHEPEQEALRAQAARNWLADSKRGRWKPFEGLPIPVLIAVGSDRTSSGLVVPQALAAARQYFESDHVFVAVPDRFTLIAAQDPARLSGLAAEYYAAAAQSRESPLCPLIFRSDSEGVTAYGDRSESAKENYSFRADRSPVKGVAELLNRVFLLVAGADRNVRREEVEAFRSALSTLATNPSGAVAPTLSLAAEEVLADPTAFLSALARDGDDRKDWWAGLEKEISTWNDRFPPAVAVQMGSGVAWLVERLASAVEAEAGVTSASDSAKTGILTLLVRSIRPPRTLQRGSLLVEDELGTKLVVTLSGFDPQRIGDELEAEFEAWAGSPEHLNRFDGRLVFALDPREVEAQEKGEAGRTKVEVRNTVDRLNDRCQKRSICNANGRLLSVAAEWRASASGSAPGSP